MNRWDQVIICTHNLDNPEPCYTSAILRMLAQAKRPSVKPNSRIDVTMAKGKKRSILLSLPALVTIHFQAAIKKVHHIKVSKGLSRFSSYSIMVWAFVIIHIHGKSPDYINLCLRWCSGTYNIIYAIYQCLLLKIHISFTG